MTAPLTNLEKALIAELSDVKAGVPSHKHTASSGEIWRCTSPYCDRGDDQRDEPQHGPGETADEAKRYRRVYA